MTTVTKTDGPSPADAADGFLAAVLRDPSTAPKLPPEAEAMLPERAFHHGVAALIAAAPRAVAALPGPVRAALDTEALGLAMWDLRHRQVLVPLLAALAGAGVPAVLLKGTALAYSVYATPALRQRGDTDILVAPRLVPQARQVLADRGFARSIDPTLGTDTGTILQETWSMVLPDGTEHVIDLHWGVLNAWSLAGLFDTDAVIARSVPLPRLSPVAHRIGPVDALYHACLHRGIHIKHPYYVGDEEITGGDRLIWVQDIHLMLPDLTAGDWSSFAGRAVADKTADLCLDALRRAALLLAAPVPPEVLATLARQTVTGGPSYLLAHATDSRRFLSNLAAIPGLLGKVAFLRMMLFPSHLYMRQRYPDMDRQPVALLYLRRIIDRLRRLPS